MTGARDAERYLVPGLVRGVEVLRLFGPDRRSITPPEMARELAIPRSTVFRIAQTLEHLGLLDRDENGSGYRLGAGLLGLGFEYIASLDVTEIGRPELERLRDATGCSAHMVVRAETEVIVVLKAAGRSAFAGGLTVGTRLPAHATVLGRMMLADLDEKALRDLYRGVRLKAYSPQTPGSLEALKRLLERDRARGWAVSDSFFESGISSVAAPVRDHTGRVVAAVNITVAGDAEVDETMVQAVTGCAAQISEALHYRPSAAVAANY